MRKYNLFCDSGFDQSSTREVFLRDIRKLSQIVDSKSFGCANGILIPIYDQLKDVLLLAAKSDNSIYHVGVRKDKLETWSRYQGRLHVFII